MDVVIPIIFPDYLVAVNTPKVDIKVPDFRPGRSIFQTQTLSFPAAKRKIPNLGHAGILFIDGETGVSKYFEYGRYDKAHLGLTRRLSIPDAKIGKDGKVTTESLKEILGEISSGAGQDGTIKGVYIETPNGFERALRYAQQREQANSNAKRKKYDLTTNSCLHFSKQTAEASGVKMPPVTDARPVGYLESLQEKFSDLEFNPKTRSLYIEGRSVPWKLSPSAASGKR